MIRGSKMNEETIHGTIVSIVFETDNGFKICDLDTGDCLITIKGSLPSVQVGETISAVGKFEVHKRYGEQFVVESYTKELPTGYDEIIGFLSSGLIPGVGIKTAKYIVDEFGDESIDIIINDPLQLTCVKGISEEKAYKISDACMIHKDMSNLVGFLTKHGINAKHAVKLYKKYGSMATDLIKSNPYRLLEDIPRIRFEKVDALALQLDYPENSYRRVCAYIIYILKSSYIRGHVYLPLMDIVYNVRVINVSEEDIVHCIGILEEEGSIVVIDGEDDRHVYLRYMYECQSFVAKKLKELSANIYHLNEDEVARGIQSFEQQTGYILASLQKEAIRTAASNGVSIITGGPGTGKTTIIKGILNLMTSLGQDVFLCAPTGRAAKRMSEMCNHEAKTIHRLLEVSSDIENDDDYYVMFKKNENEPLECDVLIVDESSMIDIILMYHLLKAVNDGCRVVFVGDKDQLPSVGPGKVLKDMLDSGLFATVTLNEIYRQESESLITVNAHRINNGQLPKLNVSDKDFFLIKRDNQERCLDTLVDVCVNRLPQTYNIDPRRDIQVLIPTKKGICGVLNVNKVLQSYLNPPSKHKKERLFGDILFREGDRVMQIRNNYNIEWERQSTLEYGKGVFNGEMGILTSIDTKGKIAHVVFDDERIVRYEFEQLNDLELCYAITVHKSQGSEFDYIVLPLFYTSPILMTRNLLYTAITRAKKMVVLIGKEDCLVHMINNNTEELRYTGLLRE